MSKETQVQDDVMALLSSAASNYSKESARDTGPKKKTKEELEKRQQQIVAKLTATKEDNIENCTKCGKHVYLAEKKEVDFKEGKAIFHQNCFRCTECNIKLELSTFASVNRVIYCKTHYGAAHQKFIASQAPASGSDKNSNTEVAAEISNKMSKMSVDNSESCGVCRKTVYLAEKLEIEIKGKKKNFHKACFKCSVCGIALTIRNYGSIDAVLYCQPHLKENQPKMAKGEFFVSPLKKPETQGNTPTGLIVEQELKASQQQEEDEDKPQIKSQPQQKEVPKEEPKAKPEPVVEDEEENRRKEREARREERRKREEASATTSTTSSSSDNGEEDEVARRQREREERRKQRELLEAQEEQARAERRRQRQSGTTESSSEQQPDNLAEEREKRRLERQKKLEEEAQKEAEETERKIQERRKRIEALKSQQS